MDAVIPDTLITTYLQMTKRADFRPAYLPESNRHRIEEMGVPDVGYYRFLYRTVGEQWRWRDRLKLSDAKLHAILSSDKTSVDVLYVNGIPAGYVELHRLARDVEIAYFGLRPGFFGQGYGKHLLSYGVARAWSEGAKRVWLHTCNLDGPYALVNYQKRGFRVVKVKREPMPDIYR
jgi:GNAT superfamily N-acetyltransferase